MPARTLLEEMPALKDFARPSRELRLYPPRVLHLAQALVPNNGRTKIGTWELGCGRCSAFDRIVDFHANRFEREVTTVKIEHQKLPQSVGTSSLNSSGVINGVAALDWRVIPFSLTSRAIIALRNSGLGLGRDFMMSSRDHSVSGFDQSSSAQAAASSGRIAATAPASHGWGSSAVMRMSRSVSRFSAVACCARTLIQANRIAATIQPHSVSDRRPI